MHIFPQSVARVLEEAGWHESRNVIHSPELPSESNLFQFAKEVLSEFGGLRIGASGEGIDCAKSEIIIDPKYLTYFNSELKEFESILQTRLVPVGELDGGHGYLVIDEEGRTYILSAMSHTLGPLAPTFSHCLELLILGKRLNRQQIEASWIDTANSGFINRYKINYNKYGKPYFVMNPKRTESQ